ncbi:MAG: hypothetical protein ACLT1K_02550 [[Clostridium] leptum]
MVKRLVCTVLAVLLLIGAASCSQTESPAESAASSKSLKESLLPAAPFGGIVTGIQYFSEAPALQPGGILRFRRVRRFF